MIVLRGRRQTSTERDLLGRLEDITGSREDGEQPQLRGAVFANFQEGWTHLDGRVNLVSPAVSTFFGSL